jgi:hypothetical protein
LIKSGKFKVKNEAGTRETIKIREHGSSSSANKNFQDEKIEEMDKLIKDLSNKLSRMEVDRVKNEPNIRNPNQFRRNFNP